MPLYPGSTVTISGSFRNTAGVPTDPTGLVLKVRNSAGTITTTTSPAAPIIHDTDGEYHADVVCGTAGDATASGLYAWEWDATGAVAAVDVGYFYVEHPMGSPRLVSLDDIKTARRGMPAALDELVDSEIVRASAACSTFANDHQFHVDAVASARVFPVQYDCAYIADLSAAPSAGGVELWQPFGTAAAAVLVEGTDYLCHPRNRSRFTPISWLELATPRPAGYELRITGKWGFPAIPEDVRAAVIETVVQWLAADQGLSGQSVDQFEPGSPPERGLPLKARDLLLKYRAPLVGAQLA